MQNIISMMDLCNTCMYKMWIKTMLDVAHDVSYRRMGCCYAVNALLRFKRVKEFDAKDMMFMPMAMGLMC